MKSKKTKRKRKERLDDLVLSIGAMAKSTQYLARRAEAQYAVEVDSIIENEDRNSHRIEHLLDEMLGFCFDDGILYLYRRLCRYYFSMDPEATTAYINAYREMWDEKNLKPTESNKTSGIRTKLSVR